jgi:hypothetical protein
MKEMASAMKTREATLDAKTAALNNAIAQVGKLPDTLGRQISQYIAAGAKASIQMISADLSQRQSKGRTRS